MPIFRYNETPGNYYAYLIEGHGNDANNGLTPETAVATLNRLVAILDTYAGALRRHAVIVKKRIYNEGITYARNASKPITFEFVGGCEIDGSGAARPSSSVNNDIFINGSFINYTSNFISNRTIVYFSNCIINGNAVIISNSTTKYIYFDKCLIKNSTVLVGSSNESILYSRQTVFENSNAGGVVTSGSGYFLDIINSIFENCSNFASSLNILRVGSVFDYNIINNSKIMNYTHSELQALGYNISGYQSINVQYNDKANNLYTVNQNSFALYRGEGGEHIGIGEGFYLTANLLFFQQSVLNNFQLTTGRLGFIDPIDNAFIETNPIDIGQIITLESAQLAAILPTVAGELTAGPVHYSHWYPAYSAASTYHKGAGVTDSAILYRSLVDDNLNNTPASSATKWERLTWQSGVSFAAGKIVQYTDDKWYKANTATSTSWVAGEWDKVVMTREWNLQVKTGRTYDECTAADWATIPYNTTPYLDSAGKGNSDDAYDPLTGAVMVFRFIAVRIDAKTIV